MPNIRGGEFIDQWPVIEEKETERGDSCERMRDNLLHHCEVKKGGHPGREGAAASPEKEEMQPRERKNRCIKKKGRRKR